jgi:hypothetical protein
MKYIIIVNKQLLESTININYYIHKITSYKKGWNGVILTLNKNRAHKYFSEKTAEKAKTFYNGKIEII